MLQKFMEEFMEKFHEKKSLFFQRLLSCVTSELRPHWRLSDISLRKDRSHPLENPLKISVFNIT